MKAMAEVLVYYFLLLKFYLIVKLSPPLVDWWGGDIIKNTIPKGYGIKTK